MTLTYGTTDITEAPCMNLGHDVSQDSKNVAYEQVYFEPKSK